MQQVLAQCTCTVHVLCARLLDEPCVGLARGLLAWVRSASIRQPTPLTTAVQWWNLETRSKPMFDMKRALRVGSYADLNIITTVMQDYVVGCGIWSDRQHQSCPCSCRGLGGGLRNTIHSLRWPVMTKRGLTLTSCTSHD